MDTELLFQPLTAASLRLPKRVLMTTIKLGYGTPQGEVVGWLASWRRTTPFNDVFWPALL